MAAGDAEGWDPRRTDTARDPPPALTGDARREAALPLSPVPLPPLPSGTRPSSPAEPLPPPPSPAPPALRLRASWAGLGWARRPPRWRGCHSDSGRRRAGDGARRGGCAAAKHPEGCG